jgi:hypothetical protein
MSASNPMHRATPCADRTDADRLRIMDTCPHCGRDLEGAELAAGVCTSDDCPRLSRFACGGRTFDTLAEAKVWADTLHRLSRLIVAIEELPPCAR